LGLYHFIKNLNANTVVMVPNDPFPELLEEVNTTAPETMAPELP
jgi:hypothetical protein